MFTDNLNHDAYQHALLEVGLLPIGTCARLTREVVFDHYPLLSLHEKEHIIAAKQKYFIEHIHCTIPNKNLISLLKSKPTEQCLLWTSADAERVYAMLKHYEIEAEFKKILFSNKRNLVDDIRVICNIFLCTPEKLIFFEDNQNIGDKLRTMGQRVQGCLTQQNIEYI